MKWVSEKKIDISFKFRRSYQTTEKKWGHAQQGLKIQLKVVIALNTLVDGVCLLILVPWSIWNAIPSPQPAHSSCTPTLTPSPCLLHSSVLVTVTPAGEVTLFPSVPRETQVKRVTIAIVCVGHGLGLGFTEHFWDAGCSGHVNTVQNNSVCGWRGRVQPHFTRNSKTIIAGLGQRGCYWWRGEATGALPVSCGRELPGRCPRQWPARAPGDCPGRRGQPGTRHSEAAPEKPISRHSPRPAARAALWKSLSLWVASEAPVKCLERDPDFWKVKGETNITGFLQQF